jgi:hypothetical protein
VTPRLIFYTELNAGPLRELIARPAVRHLVRQYGGLVALALPEFTPAYAELVRALHAREIGVIAWLRAEEGQRLDLQNYPQAIAGYRSFRAWVSAHDLPIVGVGLDLRLPPGEVGRLYNQGLSAGLRRVWLARENALYPAARTAYQDLIAAIRHDGYEAHIFQMPLLLDDRVAGTTMVQRALNVVDVAADVEVLLCASVLTVAPRAIDTGGALVWGYGSAADSIAVGSDPDECAAPWPALRRDLLLAAHFTDTIYVFSLEGCVAAGQLETLGALRWDAPARPLWRRTALLTGLRGALIGWLLLARFGPALVAWSGWLVALVLLVQRLRRRRR